jgi:lipoyl(octanoyl) transferase
MTALAATGCERNGPALQAYLLGRVDFRAALGFQRRLHFDVCGDRSQAALILCEHPPLITVGRQGSHAHIRFDGDDLRQRQWPIRWVNRGGGCLLHLPGQLAVYPIFPLDRLGLDIPGYLRRLGEAVAELLADFGLTGCVLAGDDGVRVGGRLVGAFGVAVRDWVTYFGAYVNVQPALDPFRLVQTVPSDREPMTSLERERRGPVRPSMVRQRLVEHVRARFGFGPLALFSDHPSLHGEVHRCRELTGTLGASADRL